MGDLSNSYHEIDKLAKVLLEEFGGPTENESACDMAIRLLRQYNAAVTQERERCAHIAELREFYEAGKETGFWKKGTQSNDDSAIAHHMARLACSAILTEIQSGKGGAKCGEST